MSDLVNVLVVLAVIGLVIARQLRATQVGGGRWWLIPGVMTVLAVRGGGLIDPHHHDEAIALFASEVAVGAVMGIAWAASTRLWTKADGTVWSQGTKATITVWVLGIALRAGLYGVAAARGVHQGSGSILLAVAVTLLIRSGVLLVRAQSLSPSYRTAS